MSNMNDQLEKYSKSLEQSRLEIKKTHSRGSTGNETSIALTDLADVCLRDLIKAEDISDAIISAIGGYGRCQLSPYSDLDLLIVHSQNTELSEDSIKSIIRTLWDLGWSVSSLYLTREEITEKAHADIHFFSSLLDLRILHGDKEILKDLHAELYEKVFSIGFEKFMDGKLEEINRRHMKYGATSRMLEPNVKESAGGLRDVHSLIWLNMNRSMLPSVKHEKVYSRVDSHLNEISKVRNWNPYLTKRLIESNDLMLRIRHEIHYQKSVKNDLLAFDVRDSVVENLIVDDTGNGIHRFLRNYYKSARYISNALRHAEEEIRDAKLTSKKSPGKPVNELNHIYSDGTRLYLPKESSAKFSASMTEIMEIFQYSKINSLRPSSGLLYEIESRLLEYKPSSSDLAKSRSIFIELFTDLNNLAPILRNLFETSVMNLLIPELNDIYCHAPKSRYHYYTTDEHTMRALEILEKVASLDSVGELHDVMNRLERKQELLLALLFHDIAKPHEKTESTHQVEGAVITGEILEKIKYDGNKELITRLIKHHLLMEQTAFRRDLVLPETIEKFVSKIIDHETLDALYLLTYADLYAVNPVVWSEWKRSLLSELYGRAKNHIDGHIQIEIDEVSRGLLEELEDDVDKKSFSDLLSLLPPSYQLEFDSRQIANHIDMANRVEKEIVVIESKGLFNFSEITVITADRKYLLSDICGVFSVNNASIFEAKVFTRKDKLIIDNFRVINLGDGGPLSDDVIVNIQLDLTNVLKNHISIDDLLKQHKKRWKWKAKKHREIPLYLDFDESENYSIIDITGSDSPGLLYSITRALSELNIMIYTAKISTKVDGLIDSFYVLDANGKKIGVDVSENSIRKAISDAVRTTTHLT